jgi:hypothetical protein
LATRQLYSGADARRKPAYDCSVPRSWKVAMVILVLCLIASMVISTVKLIQT